MVASRIELRQAGDIEATETVREAIDNHQAMRESVRAIKAEFEDDIQRLAEPIPAQADRLREFVSVEVLSIGAIDLGGWSSAPQLFRGSALPSRAVSRDAAKAAEVGGAIEYELRVQAAPEVAAFDGGLDFGKLDGTPITSLEVSIATGGQQETRTILVGSNGVGCRPCATLLATPVDAMVIAWTPLAVKFQDGRVERLAD